MKEHLHLKDDGGSDARHALFAFVTIPFLLAATLLYSADCKAQDNPTLKIDDDITRFAYSSGGRIAYATRHVFSVKKIDLQRDDIWICEPDSKKHRILIGEKFVRGSRPFNYTVRALRWSTDGTKIAVELATTEMINDDGDIREGISTLLLDDSGREIAIVGTDSVIPGASNAVWMSDGATVAYLKELVSVKVPPVKAPSPPAPAAVKLFTMARMKPFSSGETSLLQGHTFSIAAWSAKQDSGIAIEFDPAMTGPPRLVAIDLSRDSSRTLGTLDGYAGGLSLSPSAKKVAYWIDNGQLEVRDVDSPNRVVRLRVPLGTLAWSGDESRILVKRGATNRSGGLVWYPLPPLALAAAGEIPRITEVPPQSVLHDLEFRQFDISPDGKSLAVVEPGRRNLLVYPLPSN